MRPSPDLFFATLIHDFLVWDGQQSTTAEIEARTPSATDLPKILMDSGATRVVPCFAINASETGESNGAKRTLTVIGLLPYFLKNSDANAPAENAQITRTLTRAQASDYLDIIERRLRDLDSFNTFLDTLDTDRLTGWTIMSWRVLRQPQIARAEGQNVNQQTLSIAIELSAAWSR